MVDCTCIILCGGKSSRMQTNKALLPFGDMSLISYQYARLLNIFGRVIISTKASQKDALYAAIVNDLPNLSPEGINFVVEHKSDFSPLLGIINCFDVLETSSCFFTPVDTPFITTKTIDILMNNSYHYDVTYAKDINNSHPLIGVWKSSIKLQLIEYVASGRFKILDFLESCSTKSIYFSQFDFLNINTKYDYKKALKYLKEVDASK